LVLGGDLLPDDNALYPSRMGHGQPQFVRNQFRKAIAAIKDVSGCRAILAIFGNHDWGSSETAMRELAADGAVTILGCAKAFSHEGLHFLGYSCTPPTPFYVKDFERLDAPGDVLPLLGGARWDARFSRPSTHSAATLFKGRPTIADELASAKSPGKPWVFVAHAPPYESKLDVMYSHHLAGSKAIRAFIAKHQPLVSLHGHIHESPKVSGEFRSLIGSTICANPGESTGCLHHLLIDVDVAGGVVRHMEYGQQA